MKKLSFLFAMLALAGISVVMINACSKSETGVEANKGYQYTEFMPDQGQVIPLITQFNESFQAHKQELKSGGDLPLNEALWMLEAGVNYEFRSEKDNLEEFVYDSININVEIFIDENNVYMISGEQVCDNFNTLLSFTENELSENTGFELLMADVEIIDVGQEYAELKMTTLAAGTPPKPWACFIQSNDYWYPVGGQGYCDGPNQGQGIGSDASTRINGILNTNHCTDYGCEGSVFFTNIIIIPDIFYYEDTNGNPCFWDGPDDYCLNPQEMQFWVDKAYYVIDDLKPDNKVFIDVIFTYHVIVSETLFAHYIPQLRFGTINCTGSGN